MRIALTGSAGFIGKELTNHFHGRFEIHEYDFEKIAINPWGLIDAIQNGQKFDCVIHLGANANAQTKEISELAVQNVAYTYALSMVCASKNVRLVFASSFAVNGENGQLLSPYAWSKKIGEENIEVISRLFPDWQHISLRFTNIYGSTEQRKSNMASLPFMFLNSALRAESVEIWSKNIGDQIRVASRDFLYVKDLCGIIETIILLKEWKHKVLDVGTGKSLSLTNLVSEIHRVIPIEGRVVELPINVDQRFYQLNTKANVDLLFSMIPRMQFTPIKEAITEMLNELS